MKGGTILATPSPVENFYVVVGNQLYAQFVLDFTLLLMKSQCRSFQASNVVKSGKYDVLHFRYFNFYFIFRITGDKTQLHSGLSQSR